MSVSSAEPEKLQSYVTGARTRRTTVKGGVPSVSSQWTTVLNNSPMHGVQKGTTMSQLTTYLGDMEQMERFVKTVRAELLKADRNPDGSYSCPDARIQNALRVAGVHPPASPSFNPLTTLPGHPTGGYVDDPIAAATGNMLHDDVDLAFPGIAALLDVRRRYNSRFSDRRGAFGFGWSSVFDVALRDTGSAVEVALPDGAIVTFEQVDGAWLAFGNRLDRFERDADGHWVVWADDTDGWTFDADGACTGWFAGTARVTLARDHAGRIVEARETVSGRAWAAEWDGDGPDAQVGAIVASDGRRTEYARDERRRITRAVTPTGTQHYAWDAHFLLSVTDADGVRAFLNEYDADGRTIRQTSPFGRVTEYDYRANGMTVITDQLGVRQAMVHDARCNLTAVLDVDGSAMQIAYDHRDRRVRVTTKSGAVTRYVYDRESNRLVTRIDPDGLEERLEWDELGRQTARVARSGARWTMEYRGALRTPVRIVGPDGAVTELDVDERFDAPAAMTDADGVTLRIERDRDGQVTALVDALGGRIERTHDRFGALVAVVDQLGTAATFTYDTAGRVVRAERDTAVTTFAYSPAGRVTAATLPGDVPADVEYGPHGAVTAIVDAYGSRLGFEHDYSGRVTAVIAPDGAEYRNEYDAVGQLIAFRDPTGATVRTSYDAEGRQVEIVDAAGRRQRREFDELGRVVRTVLPDGLTTTFTYHPDGQLATATGPDGSTLTFALDTAGRVTEMTTSDGRRATVTWSPAGRLLARTSPAGRTERFEYDACGELVAVIDAGGARREYTRDAAGRVVAITAPGTRTEYRYDALGHLIGVDRDGVQTDSVRDPAGRLLAAIDATGAARQFTYDRRGLLSEAVDPAGGRMTFEYTARGTAAAQHVPGGRTTTWHYDAAGRYAGVTDPAGVATRVEYDPSGIVTAATNGSTGWTRTLDDAGRELARFAIDGTPLGAYHYDAAGRLTTAIGPDQTLEQFLWDDAGRVSEVRGPHGVTRFEHDADGFVTAMIRADGTRTEFERDATGRLVGADIGRPDGAEPPGAVDAAGRLLLGPDATVYRYDAAGRLAEIAPPDDRPTVFDYDADGLIAVERGPRGTRRFGYDDAGRVSTIDVAGQGVTEVGYDDAGRRVVERYPNGDSVRYRWDGRGRLTALTIDAGGDVRTVAIELDAFGMPRAIDGAPVAGGGLDPVVLGSGRWHVLGVRVLDRDTHQFLTPDPLLVVPGTNGAASAYTYCWHDPINFVDPSGMQAITPDEFAKIKAEAEKGFWDRHGAEVIAWAAVAVVAVAGVALIACTGPFGAAVGAGILLGGVTTLATDAVDGNGIDPRRILTGMVVGGVTGALTATGAGPIAFAAAGGVGAAADEFWAQNQAGQGYSLDKILLAGGVGALTGGLSAKINAATPARQALSEGALGATAESGNQVYGNVVHGEPYNPAKIGVAGLGGAASGWAFHGVGPDPTPNSGPPQHAAGAHRTGTPTSTVDMPPPRPETIDYADLPPSAQRVVDRGVEGANRVIDRGIEGMVAVETR